MNTRQISRWFVTNHEIKAFHIANIAIYTSCLTYGVLVLDNTKTTFPLFKENNLNDRVPFRTALFEFLSLWLNYFKHLKYVYLHCYDGQLFVNSFRLFSFSFDIASLLYLSSLSYFFLFLFHLTLFHWISRSNKWRNPITLYLVLKFNWSVRGFCGPRN